MIKMYMTKKEAIKNMYWDIFKTDILKCRKFYFIKNPVRVI